MEEVSACLEEFGREIDFEEFINGAESRYGFLLLFRGPCRQNRPLFYSLCADLTTFIRSGVQ